MQIDMQNMRTRWMRIPFLQNIVTVRQKPVKFGFFRMGLINTTFEIKREFAPNLIG